MAREIKYFNGSTTSNTTVYTVPAGRTAKVTFNYARCESGAQLLVDGHYMLIGTISGMQYGGTTIGKISSSTEAYFPPSQTQGYATDGSGSVNLITVVWYLGAGSTITTNNTFSVSVSYSFNTIEEY